LLVSVTGRHIEYASVMYRRTSSRGLELRTSASVASLSTSSHLLSV